MTPDATAPSDDAGDAADHAERDRFDQELRAGRRRARAPTARRMPISRVRSVTDSSMMFMMPMPPTSSDTAAMLPSSAVIVLRRAIERLAELLERHLLEAADVADDGARDVGPQAAAAPATAAPASRR